MLCQEFFDILKQGIDKTIIIFLFPSQPIQFIHFSSNLSQIYYIYTFKVSAWVFGLGVDLNNIQLMPHYPSQIEYSEKYSDSYYQYRHVVLPKDVYRKILTKGKLLSEPEWRALGVQQSRGWVHYEIHRPEPHILLFRRAIGTDPTTGMPPPGFNPPPDHF